ncbi:CAT RNA binding domain-containing protein, partial [Lacticaseibacillus paracasei]
MPKIAQIFNNNVALVDLDNRGQAVVRGRGIAFQ